MGDSLYVGCRRYIKGGKEYLINKCDTNIYNIRIYTEALNEFDIMCQHINNIIATKLCLIAHLTMVELMQS